MAASIGISSGSSAFKPVHGAGHGVTISKTASVPKKIWAGLPPAPPSTLKSRRLDAISAKVAVLKAKGDVVPGAAEKTSSAAVDAGVVTMEELRGEK